ncbi:unnamed protein product [Prorocentrum cordatum]|uniref:Uncharacterized protein n=1 Tax=Prorocentrum cordatum TaxID=2364126 RepID=A0ABN9WI93_9DINO|nr:unnamed protein product [Polarella glacialis]
MMAGCDFLLMPSQDTSRAACPRCTPSSTARCPSCTRQGVSRTIFDSVIGLWDEARDRSTATGFLFAGFDENKFKERLWQALEVYHKKKDPRFDEADAVERHELQLLLAEGAR